MEIEFRTRKLERCYLEYKRGVREWGEGVARAYVKAINALRAAWTVADVALLPEYRHPLKGEREGQHSITLARRPRLMFTFHEVDSETTVRIKEVHPRHYGN